jgi:hypothetical protein
LRDCAEREDAETERLFWRERDDWKAEFEKVTEPFSAFLARYKDREGSCLRRLAAGMDVNGPVSPSSASSSSAAAPAAGAGESSTAVLEGMQNLMMQQQQWELQRMRMQVQQQQAAAMANLMVRKIPLIHLNASSPG